MNGDPIKSDMALRAKRGAALLDEEYPGWEMLIDLRMLDLNGECECVLGQIGGTLFDDAAFTEMRSLLTDDVDAHSQQAWSDTLGFTAYDHPSLSGGWEMLTEAWRDEILARRDEIAELAT